MDNASFLPEDYIEQRAERRTNLISLILFGIVMIAVFAAFLVTNREWSQVRASQNAINQQYQLAAKKIDDLNELEKQKDQMLNKAELAAALVERVPRSNLLAEFINRMPDRLSLIEFELRSEKVRAKVNNKRSRRSSGRHSGPKRAKTAEEAAKEGKQKKIEVPKQTVKISMTGVAPTDLEVSRYMAKLSSFPLLNNVTLEYSEEREIDNRIMRQFKITMKLNPKADIRSIKTNIKSRDIRDPMSDGLEFGNPTKNNTVSVPTIPSGGE